MSNPESFIEEVNEELRRDRLFATFRKYGWIGALVVLAIVGGTAWNEWSSSKERAAAQAFGDSIAAALQSPTAAGRVEALGAIIAPQGQAPLIPLLQASANPAAIGEARALMRALMEDASLPQLYRDLASLRLVMLSQDAMQPAERRTLLTALAEPGRPFRVMAEEQLAYMLLEEGDEAAALDRLLALTQDQEAPEGLRNRAADIITVLSSPSQ